MEDDSEYASRQLSGLLALMALAEPETTVVPFSGASVRLRYTAPIDLRDRRLPQPQESASGADRWTKFRSFLRSDQMLRNAIYIIMNSGVQAALGFAFWVITARIFNTDAVGRASSLISATSLLAFLGLLGLNTTFIRYLPIAPQRDRLITAGITLVAVCSGFAALVYVALTPLIAPSISFIAHSLPMVVGYMLLTVGSAVNLLNDSVFIAAGKAGFNALVDGVVGGITRISFVAVLAGGGVYGIYGAASSSYTAAAIIGLLLMVRILKWRPDFRSFWQVVKPVLRFSGANYVGNVFNLLPGLVVPIIVLNRIGATGEAYYYVSFQLAALLFTATSAVEQSFLAEGASNGAMGRAVLMRSLRILLAFCIPAFILTLLVSHFVLAVFGAKYAAHAQSSLIALAIAVLPIAAENWFLTVLRLSNRLKAIVWSNVVYSMAIIGLAWVLASHGLTAVAMSWPIGASIGVFVAAVPAIKAIRRNYSDHGERLSLLISDRIARGHPPIALCLSYGEPFSF